jgi:hypothetical protein
MHDLLKRNYLSHSGREIVMNSIMTVMTYIIYEYEGCRHSKGPILFRGGATHYSDGEDRRALYYLGAEPLTIPMVRGHSLFIW